MEFKEKQVLVLVRSRPFGKVTNFEGWRAAVGMFGMDHIPTLLFLDDGVYALLKKMDVTPIRLFKSTFESFGGKICAGMRSLEERHLSPEELFEGITLLDEYQIGSILNESETIITF